jgi:UDP-N-acetylmuramyl pentapeptide phosphotransferase/UDP-N-acetylglucosamine-1-phosphate transferase
VTTTTTTPTTGGNVEEKEEVIPVMQNVTANVTVEGICYLKDFFQKPTKKEWTFYGVIGFFILFSIIMMLASIDLFRKLLPDKSIASKRARFWTALAMIFFYAGSYFVISRFDTYGCLETKNKLIIAAILFVFFILLYIIFLFIDFAKKK